MRGSWIIAAAAAAALLLGGCSAGTEPGPGAGANGATRSAQANAEHNAADAAFAIQMVAHHRRTLELTDLLREKDGIGSEISALAAKIDSVHKPEIAQLESMLRTWGEFTDTSESQRSGAPMSGDVTGGIDAEDMSRMGTAEGEAAAQLYLELMIAHHESSIAVAEKELAEGANAEALALAEMIAQTQRMELERMEALQQ